jgi:hypothetical protein
MSPSLYPKSKGWRNPRVVEKLIILAMIDDTSGRLSPANSNPDLGAGASAGAAPGTARDELRRLHFVNTLFARLTGDDLYLARQIRDAISFSLNEFTAQTHSHPEFAARYDAAFTAAAARLLETLFAAQPEHGFFHWDALGSQNSAAPLFARAELMAGLKRLTPYREATLLITNLRPALLPASQRPSPRRAREYEDALAYIQDLVAARTRPDGNLRLLFI